MNYSATGSVFLDGSLKDEEKEKLSQTLGAAVSTSHVEGARDDTLTFIVLRHNICNEKIFSALKTLADRIFFGILTLEGESGNKERYTFNDAERKWKKNHCSDVFQRMDLKGYGRSSMYGYLG